MIDPFAVAIPVVIGLAALAGVSIIGRKTLHAAIRRAETNAAERVRVAESRLHEQLHRVEEIVRMQGVCCEKDAATARRAEDNLREVAKGLTDVSIRLDERLKAVERKIP